MKIENNTVVCFSYTLKNSKGDIVEQSPDNEPEVYLHGAGGILPAMERQLAGKQAGDKLQFELAAGEAYGKHREDMIQRIAVKHLRPAKGKLRTGAIAHIQTEQGMRQVRIIKMGKFQATVDANHPLAGEDVSFEIDISQVRAATEEELAHGHAHGADGSASHH